MVRKKKDEFEIYGKPMKKKSRPRFNMRSAKHQAAMIDMLATMIAGVMVRQFAKSESKPKHKIRKQYAKKKAR